jgi:hypothetical protein
VCRVHGRSPHRRRLGRHPAAGRTEEGGVAAGFGRASVMDRAFVEGKKRTEIEADDRSRYVEVEMTMFRR